jgi:predicted dehydrogenase
MSERLVETEAMNRRMFLQISAGAAAAGSRILGANDRINVAIVGFGNRAHDLVPVFGKLPGCRVAAICDIDQSRLAAGVEFAVQAQGSKPSAYQDIRKLLENKDIDALAISACNHWHALATIWGCQAGKDVYVEKPCSHNVWEGRRMVEAARKYKRIIQVGMQGRSLEHKKRAIELLHQGVIGKLYLAKGLCYKRRLSIGHLADGPAPSGVDYDIWRGPAPMRPFNANRFHYKWHWFWDTGNGDIGNQGPHQLDLARWGLGKTTHPRTIESSGGKVVYDDDQETPNILLTTYRYSDCEIQFEVRGLPTNGEGDIAYDPRNKGYIGNLYYGSDGFMALDYSGFRIYKGEGREPVEQMKYTEPEADDNVPHAQNFLDCMRTRKYVDLAANIEDGHISTSLAHLANISYRLGRGLEFDPATETFLHDAEANRYLTREYRRPFVVPSEV